MTTRTPRASKRILAAIAAVGIAASAFAIASPAQATQSVVESRVGGLDRYATAAQVAQATFTSATVNSNIILASGLNFPDGLAAAGLAGAAKAPVLLTDPNSLPGVTQNALAAVFGSSPTKTVHIVGGESAVSAAVAGQVTALGYTVNRIAGDNRYETAADIAAFQATLAPVGITTVAGIPLRTAIVATGENFPDALSGGAPAFKGRHPILLTASTSLPTATSDALTSLNVQRVILLGGDSAVSADVATAIGALGTGIRVDRVSGANRGETAQALANVLVSTPANGGFGFYAAPVSATCLGGASVAGPNLGVIVNGNGFADALAAGPHAGACSAPILIAGSPATATFLTANSGKVGVVRAIGGLAAVPAADLTAAATAATAGTPTSMLTIHQGNPVIKVDFSTVISGTGDVKVNNGLDLCPVPALTALPAGGAALAVGSCYLVTANGVTTLWLAAPANLNVGDSVVASGFTTPAAAGALVAATASMTVPATPAQLTGAIAGAIVNGTAPTVTFNRPVNTAGVAGDVTIVKAADPTTVINLGPLAPINALNNQLKVTGAINLAAGPAGTSPLTAGDVITVKRAAVVGVVGAASLNLQADITAVVQSAGAAPALSTATGVLTASGGVQNTEGSINDTNVVVQAKSALPAGAVTVVYDSATNAGSAGVATTAAAVLNNTNGITTITVKLGTIGPVGTTLAPDATSSQVAAAINAGASAVVTATPSNVLSLAPVGTIPVGSTTAGTRLLSVTGTSTKPLTAISVGAMTYDGNNDGFADTVVDAIPGLVGNPTLTSLHGYTAGATVQHLRGDLQPRSRYAPDEHRCFVHRWYVEGPAGARVAHGCDCGDSTGQIIPVAAP